MILFTSTFFRSIFIVISIFTLITYISKFVIIIIIFSLNIMIREIILNLIIRVYFLIIYILAIIIWDYITNINKIIIRGCIIYIRNYILIIIISLRNFLPISTTWFFLFFFRKKIYKFYFAFTIKAYWYFIFINSFNWHSINVLSYIITTNIYLDYKNFKIFNMTK